MFCFYDYLHFSMHWSNGVEYIVNRFFFTWERINKKCRNELQKASCRWRNGRERWLRLFDAVKWIRRSNTLVLDYCRYENYCERTGDKPADSYLKAQYRLCLEIESNIIRIGSRFRVRYTPSKIVRFIKSGLLLVCL